MWGCSLPFEQACVTIVLNLRNQAARTGECGYADDSIERCAWRLLQSAFLQIKERL